MVKFFEIEARFPERHYEFPSAAVEFVAKQIRVGVSEFRFYQFKGRTAEYHRAQIRAHFGSVRLPALTRSSRARGWLARSARAS